jgi:tryptophanyl-tRNA synthetase
MSKSSPLAASRIELTDSSSAISAKVRTAVTDSKTGISFDPTGRPGVANLLTILAACRPATERATPVSEAARLKDLNMADFKAEVAAAVENVIGPIRTELERLMGDDYLRDRAKGGAGGVRMKEEAYLREVAERGAQAARERAADVLADVKRLVGLSRF